MTDNNRQLRNDILVCIGSTPKHPDEIVRLLRDYDATAIRAELLGMLYSESLEFSYYKKLAIKKSLQ